MGSSSGPADSNSRRARAEAKKNRASSAVTGQKNRTPGCGFSGGFGSAELDGHEDLVAFTLYQEGDAAARLVDEAAQLIDRFQRSEERRVGKECRSRGS